MNRVYRIALSEKQSNYLVKKQKETDWQYPLPGWNASEKWESARQTVTIETIADKLKRMAIPVGRCMYCAHSEGGDIEHFRPKAAYPGFMFVWENLLLCCSQCGRIKLDKFPTDANGNPLLINPALENPWDFLDFEPDTGNLTARVLIEKKAASDKGTQTVSVLHLDKREILATAYQNSFKRIVEALEINYTSADELWKRLTLADEHGILEWCFLHNGVSNTRIVAFKAADSDAFAYIVEKLSERHRS